MYHFCVVIFRVLIQLLQAKVKMTHSKHNEKRSLPVFPHCFSILVILCHMTSCASSLPFALKTLVFVDHLAVEQWRHLSLEPNKSIHHFHHEILSIMLETNEMLKTLNDCDDPIDIRLQPEIVIHETPFLPDHEQESIAQHFTEFGEHLDQKFDLAIFYTGQDLILNGTRVKGKAFGKSVCSPKAIAIIRYNATFLDAIITAHEIGHVLGATNHSGHGSAVDCPDVGEVFIMTDRPAPHYRNIFSNCSAISIRQHFDSVKSNCVGASYSSIPAVRYGHLINGDVFCARWLGHPKSYYKRDGNYGDKMCQSFGCLDRTQRFSAETATPPGTPCGMNKMCIEGYCLSQELIDFPDENQTPTLEAETNINDNCVFGDQPDILFISNAYTCPQLPSFWVCEHLPENCCETCSL